MDLIDKAKQLNISHFTVHDFVDEIASLREQLSNMMAVVAQLEQKRDELALSLECYRDNAYYSQ